ncbi:uncharacterized protein LOC142569516 [Dermacentor variabilis]|uniref:uncharacterized protein LOC142569516 n=1 Tax=Dermacentor variabilis TaxID=34621 RepID=UPI003F5CAD5B
MDFDTHFSKTTRAAVLRHQQQCPHTATRGLNFLVGAGNAAGVRGSFLLAAAPFRRSFGPGTVGHAPLSTEPRTAESTAKESAILVADRLVQSRRGFSLHLQKPRRWLTGGGTSSQLAQRVIEGDL